MLGSLISGIKLDPPENLQCDKNCTLCISGHREKSIIPYQNNSMYREITVKTVKLLLSRYIDLAYMNGYSNFISGFAIGTDLWAAEHIIKRRQEGWDIHLIGAIPFRRHADYFPKHYIDILYKAERFADQLIVTNSNPNIIYSSNPLNINQSKDLYRARNYFMVDNSSAIISFYDESKNRSGTSQTINYAIKNNLIICRFGTEQVYSLIKNYNGDLNKIKIAIQRMN